MSYIQTKEMHGLKIETRDFAPHVVRAGWEEKQGSRAVRVALVVHFGLHHLRGNSSPHFSITADGRENGRESFGGCCHDIIAKRFPELRDMIALHLSDMDGAPMHAASNGLYWLGGIVDLGLKYHGGSGDYGKSAMECARIFANLARVSEQDAIRLAGVANTTCKKLGIDAARKEFEEWTDTQRPRWKSEANAAIRKYQLGVYGDNHKTPADTLALIGA